jgi:glycosyltransferase involved in cell wall biosynthesis
VNILLVVPLPPPVTGHSLASQMLLRGLDRVHETAVVNLSVGSRNDGRITPRRIAEVGRVLAAVWRKTRRADAIYFTISESRAGNLKDILIYVLCAGRLNRLFIHLHGGTIGRELFDRHPLLRKVNGYFIKRLAGVIISGPSHIEIFDGIIDPERIHIVPNSAEDDLFVPEREVLEKFAAADPVRVLYLSAMTVEKGCLDLLQGWLGLDPQTRDRIRVDFAGRFDSEADRDAFLQRISGLEGVRYHGLVDPEHKRRLFAQAHVFCLPTRMLEGQPISILEAYATGCAVIATGQRGIRDIFGDGVNGLEVCERSPSSIRDALVSAASDIDNLRRMALGNRRLAGERYRASTFTSALTRILEGAGDGERLVHV